MFRFTFQQFQPAFDIFLAALLFEPLADFRPRLGRSDDIEPVGTRSVVLLVRDYRNDVAVLQFIFKRYDFAVDFSTDAVIADIRMNMVGKINRIGTLRQIDNVAARRVDEYFIGENIDFQRFKVFARVGEFIL